jgi:catechol 2,3-dioxygenase-like lactoylglutathione lyase family enzyme
MPSPLWPATLHHFRLNSEAPEALVTFYEEALGLASRPVGEGLWHLAGPQRRLLIGRGERETVGYSAFALDEPERLSALSAYFAAQGIAIEANPSPLFANAAFSIVDPDGQRLVFGVPAAEVDAHAPADGLPARTQHIVFATTDLGAITRFYRDALGYLVSDEVVAEAGEATAAFFRSDEEHHSYAAFRADGRRYDHHAMEVRAWDDIRDWADHFAGLEVPIWWGPGRHGPGNNLFFMVRDPDGNRIELSAELERMPRRMAGRSWPHNERTLNLWGAGWMRS